MKITRKMLLRFLLQIGIFLALNIIAKLLAGMIMGSYNYIRSWYQTGPIKLTDMVDIASEMSYGFLLIAGILMVFIEKSKFTYGDAQEEWATVRNERTICNAIAYFVVSLPTNLYFLIYGIEGVYYPSTHVIEGHIQESESLWIAGFFSPQCAFFRITKNVWLGILLNLVIFIGITSILYMKKPKER